MLSKTSTDSPPTETRVQPPRKRSRLLGDIDLNSPEVQKLLKAGSSHASAVNEVSNSLNRENQGQVLSCQTLVKFVHSTLLQFTQLYEGILGYRQWWIFVCR